jgi:hypothetical protein
VLFFCLFFSLRFLQSHNTPWSRRLEEEVQLLLIHDFGTRWGEWSASRHGRALPQAKDPNTHWTGGWVGPSAGLDTEAREKKILCPCRGSNIARPVVQAVVRHYTD